MSTDPESFSDRIDRLHRQNPLASFDIREPNTSQVYKALAAETAAIWEAILAIRDEIVRLDTRN